MASSLRLSALVVVMLLGIATCMPAPGFGGGHHKHFIIHVPYHVHHVHHIRKVPVYIKTHHYNHYTHHDYVHDHDHHGWEYD